MRDPMDNVPVHTLFCIPYAGGNAFFYNPLKTYADTFCLKPLELPGRGRRSAEPLCTSFDVLVRDLCSQMISLVGNEPYAILGHSMGAALAYACAQHMREIGFAQPKVLFVSGCRAPVYGFIRRAQPRYLLPRQDFFDMLRKFGGCPDEVFNAPKLLEYFEPILRADFCAVETWCPPEQTPLDIPITALSGKSDVISEDAMLAWARTTHKNCQVHMFAGGHFFIQQHWQEIAGIMRESLCAPCEA